ncbi:MAG: HAMP domain-containing histidine kinase [Alphaproteobacteria bacterium]|nr:HAMP domain-containing histidine kinase [Alphaproteobacteria bacterium]
MASLIQARHNKDIEVARAHFTKEHHDQAAQDTARVDSALHAIRENLRLLAALPAVRGIDRHGENLSPEGRIILQQIYDNLANDVDVSEIYLLPIGFEPNRIDPITLKKEAPIIALDQLIVGGGKQLSQQGMKGATFGNFPSHAALPPEIEDYEYAQMVEQASWFSKYYPSEDRITGKDLPMISGPEIITCDNTQFILSGKEADRSGLVFSVPFFDGDGKVKGMVSAIILTNALKALLPAHHLALVNPTYGYAAAGREMGELTSSAALMGQAQPDPSMVYSEVFPLAQADQRSTWSIWTGAPESEFNASRDVEEAGQKRFNSLLLLGLFALLATGFLVLVRRSLMSARALARSHMRAKNIAHKQEAEAKAAADQFKKLNDDISQLNTELNDRLHQLSEAQDQIIASGKMAQLGQLVATVAHEIRNPLGGVRTTLFTLRRKCEAAGVDAGLQIKRIETGVNRCDAIITQLLDFSRSQAIQAETQDIVAWLRGLVEDFGEDAPAPLSINLFLGEDQRDAAYDAERLRRAVVNLMSNAREAVLSKHMVNSRAPVIEVELRNSARGIEIEVRDNGPGIPRDIMDKIGEPFFTSKSFGSGLGVAAAKQVAKLHGGGLEFSSEAGQGATFTLWLPLLPVQAASAA